MVKKAIVIIIVVLLLGFFYNFIQQISDSLQVSKRLDQEAEDLANLQKENSLLKKQVVTSQTLGAVEEIARNKLGLSRLGESVVVISPEQIDQLLAAQQVEIVEKVPNWQGWLKLFLH